MITMMDVQTINVATYFEYDHNVSLETLMKRHNLLLGDGSEMGIVNKVISKKEAIRLAEDLHRERCAEFSELWVSSDALRAKDIRDYMGERVFELVEAEVSGWVVFYDPSTYMNWDHECEYHFIVDENCIETCLYFRAPEEAMNMEKI